MGESTIFWRLRLSLRGTSEAIGGLGSFFKRRDRMRNGTLPGGHPLQVALDGVEFGRVI